MHFVLRVALFGGLALAGVSRVQAQDYESDCIAQGNRSSQAASLYRVAKSASPVYFVKERDKTNRCPSAEASCRKKDSVGAGDSVVGWVEKDGYVCASHVGKSRSSSGWLPADALQEQPGHSVPAADWAGHWQRDSGEASVDIAASGHILTIKGFATWGANDPKLAGHGGVNVGELDSSEILVSGVVLRYSPGKVPKVDANTPIGDPEEDSGDQPDINADKSTCTVAMQRIGDLLSVVDNSVCGGFNVSFTGLYRRAK